MSFVIPLSKVSDANGYRAGARHWHWPEWPGTVSTCQTASA